MGDFWGDFLLSLGDFLTKTSGHPVGQFEWNIECHRCAFDNCEKFEKFEKFPAKRNGTERKTD